MTSRFSSDRWRVLSPQLDHALELTAEARAEWLAALRADDGALAVDLEALLQDHGRLDREGFLEDVLRPAAEASLAGQALGAYTLRAPVGQGGMGTVWLADRSDGRFEGVAAVKLLHANLLGRGGEARFRREGSILARLRHPHIAHLIDAGVSSFGHPFLVLEHVDGERIDEYCDARTLSIEARVGLFLDVLAAVAHAHANLIVHRDIKPSNVLVTGGGQVKLLDFGIAKLLEGQDGAGEATALTREGEGLLTPEYAAPEQLTGDDVTTATDVYALGVLLYLVLSGRHPARTATGSPAELVQAIVHTDPLRPSAAVNTPAPSGADPEAQAARRASSPRKLQKALQGDLDNIVAKALRKRPSERYGSVGAMADDLRRVLAHEPVSARAPSLAYRATKFVRRNRAPVALAMLAVAALAVGLLGTLTQARRAAREAQAAERQRDFALRELSRAEAINELNMFLLSDAAPGGKPFTVGDLLASAERILERQKGETDENRAEILIALGRQYDSHDQLARARRLLTEAYEMTRGGESGATGAKAACALASALAKASEFERAQALLQEGLAQLSDEPQFTLHRVYCLMRGGDVARWTGQGEKAVERIQEARRLLPQARQGSALIDVKLAMDLAESYRVAGRAREADAAFRQAWSQLTALGRDDTERAGTLLNNWALVLMRDLGQPLAAEGLFRRAFEIGSADEAEGRVSPMLLNNYARVLMDLGRLQESKRYAERANVAARQAGSETVITFSLFVRSLLYLRLGDLSRVARLLAELEPRVARHPRGHSAHATLASLQALLAQARSDTPAARAAHDRAVALSDAPSLPGLLLRRSGFELVTHRPEEARVDAARALALLLGTVGPGPSSSHVGLAHLALARALGAQGNVAEARASYAAAFRNLAPTVGADHPDTREARQHAGNEVR